MSVAISRSPSFTIVRPIRVPPVVIASAVALAGALYLGLAYNWTQAALFVVGLLAGFVLYHAAFGFTSSWRELIVNRRGEGLRAQMVMLALTCTVFIPLIASGQVLGHPVRGSVSPLGVSVAVGAFARGAAGWILGHPVRLGVCRPPVP